MEACSVIRQFDEQTLAAVSDRTDIGQAFDRLCRLSVVRPAEHGLSLHEDVQRIVADDLLWRNRGRHRELRMRALTHYRDRAHAAPPHEREWLLAERLYLWGNEVIQPLVFEVPRGEHVALEPAEPTDTRELQAIWGRYLAELAGDRSLERTGADLELIEWLLAEPAARVRVARTANGTAVGFSSSVRLDRESGARLRRHPIFGPVLEAYLRAGTVDLPPSAAESPVRYLLQAAAVAPDAGRPAAAETAAESAAPARARAAGAGTASTQMGRERDPTVDAAQAALLLDAMGLFASGGAFLAAVTTAERKQLCRALGFRPVEGALVNMGPGVEPVEGFVLDLRGVGVEAWLDALVQGRKPPRGLSAGELERELQTVLARWPEDDVLASSPLIDLAPSDGEAPDPEAVRSLVRSALQRARQGASEDQQLAYRALELAYLDRGLSHERAAERLSVSRSTFYRLLKRAVRGLAGSMAQTLTEPPRDGRFAS
jgi:DNA-directed RNA polymerase specialized sigma24 family protein